MAKSDPSVAVAHIHARSVILGALFGALGPLAVAMVNNYSRKSEGTGQAGTTAVAPLANAPYSNFFALDTDLDLAACKQKAQAAIAAKDLTGPQSRAFYAFGYHGETVGIVWCHTDAKQLIFMASGRSEKDVNEVIEGLRQAF